MRTSRLRERAPSARIVGPAQLLDYELRIHKRARDGSAKCNVVGSPGGVVHGVLFEIDESDWDALDRAESRGAGYERVQRIFAGRTADLYIAPAGYIDESLLPYTWYLEHVVAGAREHGLPEEYIARLAGHVAIIDPGSRAS